METPPNQQPPPAAESEPAKGKLPRAPVLDLDSDDGSGKRKKTILTGLLIIALLVAGITVAYNVFNTGRRGETGSLRQSRKNVTDIEATKELPVEAESGPSARKGRDVAGRTSAQAKTTEDKKEDVRATTDRKSTEATPSTPEKPSAPVVAVAPAKKATPAAKSKPVKKKETRPAAKSDAGSSEDKQPGDTSKSVQSVYDNVDIPRTSDLIDITAITESKNIGASNNLFAWPGGKSAGGSKSVFEKSPNFMGKENSPAEADFSRSKVLYMVLVQESLTPEPLREVARKLEVMTLAPEIKKTISHGRQIYWLTVGHYTSKTAAANKAQEIRNMGFPTTVVSEKVY